MIMGQDANDPGPMPPNQPSDNIGVTIIDNIGKLASDLIAGIFGKEPTGGGSGGAPPASPAPVDYTPFVIVGVPLAAIAVFAALRK